MATTDIRTRTGTDKGKRQGRVNVKYRDAKGRYFDCEVVGQGSVSGLKLYNPSTDAYLDNVAVNTATPHAAGTYSYRIQ